MMYGYHMGNGWWIVPMIFGTIFWILIIVGLVFLIRWLATATSQQGVRGGAFESGGESALDIAQKRYARGEISKEQYDEIVQHIKETSG